VADPPVWLAYNYDHIWQAAGGGSGVVKWGCYEQADVLPSFSTRERFPFCAVLEEGRALVYWDHDLLKLKHHDDKAGTTVTVKANSSSSSSSSSSGSSGE
jgi:hypothetical protein